MASVFIKVPVRERLPKESGSYWVIVSNEFFSQADFYYSILTDKDEWSRNNITHWIEEIELPTEESITYYADDYDLYPEEKQGFIKGANFILDKLKGGNK